MKKEKTGANTLLWSIIMSSPGPLVMGLGLIVGRSSTQIADFLRRSAELLAIIMSYIVYNATHKNGYCYDEDRKRRSESRSNMFVGAMMCLAGAVMAVIAFAIKSEDKGNVLTGFLAAACGAVTNTIFWVKYTRLNRNEQNAILAVQARLYHAKAVVDICVTVALTVVLISPTSAVSYWLDMIGSLIVAVYMIQCGVRTIYQEAKAAPAKKDP